MNDKKAPNVGKGVLLIAADILLIAFFVVIAIRVYTGGGGIGGLLFTALVGFLVSFGLGFAAVQSLVVKKTDEELHEENLRRYGVDDDYEEDENIAEDLECEETEITDEI